MQHFYSPLSVVYTTTIRPDIGGGQEIYSKNSSNFMKCNKKSVIYVIIAVV